MLSNPIFITKDLTTFYLLPFRSYEFLIGAFIATLNPSDFKKNIFHELLTLFGIALIIFALCFFHSETVHWPSTNALIPCIGAALIIFSGHSTYIGRLFRNKIVVFLGLISYSLYLVHWPIIVFWKLKISSDLSLIDKVAIISISIILAFFIFKVIENPCRYFENTKKNILKFLTFIFSFIIICIVISSIDKDPESFTKKAWDSEKKFLKFTQENKGKFIRCLRSEI